MCGFAGQFTFHGAKPDINLVKRMADSIHHRGPDDEGYEAGEWFALAFKRLSILDVSDSAHQPMKSDDGKHILIFNGEVYNFREIRQILESEGYKFRSSGDTEVVLKALDLWGPAALQKFRGMFALVLVDLEKHTALLARDHLGIKPLYFLRQGHQLFFASEVKALKSASRLSLNHNALHEQFTFRSVAGTRTIFNEIQRLKPGSFLMLDREGASTESTFYSISATLHEERHPLTDPDELQELLQGSIRLHTVSDVGYNVQLSGGIDSSYLTTALAKEGNTDFRTYSVELPGSLHDESKYQKQVATKFQTQHHALSFNSHEYADLFEKAIWYMDFPLAHSGCPLLMGLCFEAKKTSKVILTGEGADELFLGYSRYRLSRRQRLGFRLRSLGVNPKMIPGLPYLKGLKRSIEKDISIESLAFDSDVMGRLIKAPIDQQYRHDVVQNLPGLIERLIASDQECYLQTLLERQDRMSMAASVESRVPFCNPDLFSRLNRIAHTTKIDPEPKILLKKLLEKDFSQDFVYRRKNGFHLPLKEWFRDSKGMGRYLDLLTDHTFRQRSFYNHKLIEQVVNDHRQGLNDRSKELFVLVGFEIWHRQFIDQ